MDNNSEAMQAANWFEQRGYVGEKNSVKNGYWQKIKAALSQQAESLPNEQGANRYGLDMAYFRNLITRELNHSRGLHDYKPSELARVFARMAAAADRAVLAEPEFQQQESAEPVGLQAKKLKFLQDRADFRRQRWDQVAKLDFADGHSCYVDAHGRVLWLQSQPDAVPQTETADYKAGWDACLESNYWRTPRHQPDWKCWADEQPAEPGMYLTHWSDGSLETYPLDEHEIEESEVTLGSSTAELTHWAELPQAPEVPNG